MDRSSKRSSDLRRTKTATSDGLQPAPLLARSDLSDLSDLFLARTCVHPHTRARADAHAYENIRRTGRTGRTDSTTARLPGGPTYSPGRTERGKVGPMIWLRESQYHEVSADGYSVAAVGGADGWQFSAWTPDQFPHIPRREFPPLDCCPSGTWARGKPFPRRFRCLGFCPTAEAARALCEVHALAGGPSPQCE